MNYAEILEEIFRAFPMYHKVGSSAYKEGFENIEAVLSAIGHPERKLRCVHVAGTNGKGSVSHLLSSFFQEAGWKTGLFTSPHLLDFSERIRVNGQNIPPDYVVRFFERFNQKIKEIEPSFFEITTALAFDFFASEKVDVAVIETGLGGRLDATNVITPLLSVITNISLEHTALLGDTIAKIAAEKAGIIKENVPVVVGETHPESLLVFQEKAQRLHAPLLVADAEFKVSFTEPFNAVAGRRLLHVERNGRPLFDDVFSPLQGDYQQKNIATFIAAALRLADLCALDTKYVRQAIENVQDNVFLPGRWQIVEQQPLVICDTGHNFGCLSNTMEQLKLLKCRKLHIVLGFVNDKNLEPIFPVLPPQATYYLCAAQLERALPVASLANAMRERGFAFQTFDSVCAAYEAARQSADKEDVVFVGGSTFVVAEFLKESLPKPVLSIKNFSFAFKNGEDWKEVLHQVDFVLPQGKIVGIVGESGSGKSVTALSVMRLISSKVSRVSGGDIRFYDRNGGSEMSLLSLSEKELRAIRGNRIAMIFQEPMTSLNPAIKCGKQITEALLLHRGMSKRAARERVLELFREVMLPRPEKIFESYPFELSGGQKQRVMIAMAMSCDPDVLIADEPTTALDVTVQKGILELIKKLQREHGMSVLFITHDLGVVKQIADEVVVLFKGKIVEKGEMKKIFDHPQHPYTKGLLACRPPLDKRLRQLPTVHDFLARYEAGERHEIETVCSDLEITAVERERNHQLVYAQPPILRVEHLSKLYPLRKEHLFEKRQYLPALQDINLEVYEGETLGLVGESGCGKTTLGRAILQLIKPSSGKVFYKNQELTALSQREMRKVRQEMQIILQDPYSSLNQRITVGAALMEPMKIQGIGCNEADRRRRAIELLERVDLNETHFYRYPHEFSGGQRQRISIARALAVNPKFIICDESVSALDVSVQAQVLNLLNELKKEFHFTYIFISHDLSVVKFMSDRMAVMQKGRIVELNEADDLYAHPRTDYTRNLIAAIPQ